MRELPKKVSKLKNYQRQDNKKHSDDLLNKMEGTEKKKTKWQS